MDSRLKTASQSCCSCRLKLMLACSYSIHVHFRFAQIFELTSLFVQTTFLHGGFGGALRRDLGLRADYHDLHPNHCHMNHLRLDVLLNVKRNHLERLHYSIQCHPFPSHLSFSTAYESIDFDFVT